MQQQPVEQVRRLRHLGSLPADQQVEEQATGSAEGETRVGLGLRVGDPGVTPNPSPFSAPARDLPELPL